MPFDWTKLLELAPLALAKPGSPQAAAMMQGYLQSQQRMEQERRQQGLDAGQDQLRQAQMGNLTADNERANQQMEMSKAQQALQRLTQAQGAMAPWAQQLGETATDPDAAQQQFATQAGTMEQAYQIPTGQLSAMMPPLAPVISARKKKQAKDLYDQAEKRYGAEAMASDSITLQSEQFGDVKPSALRQMFESPAVNAQGQPAIPMVGKQTPPTPGSFEEFVGASPERQAQIGSARKQYMQSDDTAKTQPRDRYNVQPVTNPDGTIGLIRVNMETGETTRVSLPEGVSGAGKPNPTEQLSSAFLIRTEASDKTARSFESQLAALGPQLDVQLPNLLKSQTGQLYRQAQDEFINAALRRESGAAIQPSEYERFAKIYFVQPGDKSAAIAQKQAARDRVVAGFRTATGNLGKRDGETIRMRAPDGRVLSVPLGDVSRLEALGAKRE